MINRQAEIKKKGFNMVREEQPSFSPNTDSIPVDFSKIKVGKQTLEDATLNLGDYRRIDPRLGDKQAVLRAIRSGDLFKMREISNFFYKTSGIYSRLCRYIAYLYKYDWMITPFVVSDKVKPEVVVDTFNKALKYFDDFQIKRWFGEVALKVVRNGCYYGYIVRNGDQISVQELPPNYCRSRYEGPGGRPAVEFDLKFFDDTFTDTVRRMKILNLFPDEFKKAYILYKEGKLPKDFVGDTAGWYLLDIENTIKFNLNGEDFPAFISVIPAIINLDDAQALDRKRMQQKLARIIIQQMPVDKNGDLVFDVDEAQQLHNNAVQMVGGALGVSVLTTFADVEVEDMSDSNTTTSTDELEKVERTVYNEAGVSQMQFNTDGNLALEKSIANDEALMLNLLVQFEAFLNQVLLKDFNKNSKKLYFRAQLLPTSIYNYRDLADKYKAQTQMGYSKMLPQIALGQSQSVILASAAFENNILDLVNVFIPPLMSSTMSADVLDRNKSGSSTSSGDGEVGRDEKPDDEKSEKTIANRESMS